MARADREAKVTRFLSRHWTTIEQFAMGIAGALLGAVAFAKLSDLSRPYVHELLKFFHIDVYFSQNGEDRFPHFNIVVAVVAAASVIYRVVQKFLGQWSAMPVSNRVADAIGHLKAELPGKNISEITPEEVAASPALKGTKVGKEALGQLVEQHKQQLLIDDNYFREELGSLIVDYLQPLPRNVKRLLNRFRVNLLIAHGRGLFSTDPKVSTQQLGKWLVLMERWPQLGRSLSTVPDKMKTLEEFSARPAPSMADPPAPDPFMDMVKALTPFYVGDEDLRKFIHSSPQLGTVVGRIAHFGTDQAPAAAIAATT